jgi:hypothetical protein
VIHTSVCPCPKGALFAASPPYQPSYVPSYRAARCLTHRSSELFEGPTYPENRYNRRNMARSLARAEKLYPCNVVIPCRLGVPKHLLALSRHRVILAEEGLMGKARICGAREVAFEPAPRDSLRVSLGDFWRNLTFATLDDMSYALSCLQIQQDHYRGMCVVPDCTYLGGSGTELTPGEVYDVTYRGDRIGILPLGGASIRHTILKVETLQELQVGGPGPVTTGGGFIGGGTGLVGAVEGAAIASTLNTLTTRTRIESLISILARGSEMFFANGQFVPDELRRLLSPVFVAIRNNRETPFQERPAKPDGGIVSQLERLSQLRQAGLLSDAEFDLAKSRVIGESSQ